MMDVKEGLLLWFTNFLIKSSQVVVLISMQINLLLITNYFKNQFLQNFKKEQFIQDLKTIFGMLINKQV